MNGVNKVIIVGLLGADPEIRYTNAGTAVANLRVATTEKWKDKESGETREATEWHRIVLFDRLAEVAEKYLKKGSPVYVEGKLRTRKWEDKDGATRYSTEVLGDNLQLLGRAPGHEQEHEQAAPEKAAPAQQRPKGPAPKTPAQRIKEMEDDIPF